MSGAGNATSDANRSKQSLKFVKMSGAGNDFVIFDARETLISLTPQQIQKISDRKNIGCDQVIILKNFAKADCEMEIYNSDGSKSGACGNATRCVAAILFGLLSSPSGVEGRFPSGVEGKTAQTPTPSTPLREQIKIKTAAGILKCWHDGDLISVDMGAPKFENDVTLFGFDFSCIDVGNPHAVTFLNKKISDEKFFEIGPKVESDKIFPNKTNVEFARILSDDLIEVRVFERGAGETLACGSGACAVATLAIEKKLVNSRKITIRFKGGDLQIEWNGTSIVMTGGFKKEFDGVIGDEFLA